MTTTAERPRVSHGSRGRLFELPEALQLVTGKSRIVMLPQKWGGEPVTLCECRGLLVYVRGAFRHSDTCLSCHGAPDGADPCTERHFGCSQPEFVECRHLRCGAPVEIADQCADDKDPNGCCGCCQNRDDLPDYGDRYPGRWR